MGRKVRGVLAVEGVQTGDGRFIVEGALTWADLPLPLAWIRDGDQHVMPGAAPQVGTIQTITRSGGEVQWTGEIDDGQPDGAEVIRRMEAQLAPLGPRFGISIDPDDWQVEVIATEMDEEAMDDADDLVLVASGAGPLVDLRRRRSVTAAAGDGDPEEGVVLFEDASDSVIERYTRLRIRGATACAVAAFDVAYMELDGEAEGTGTPAASDEPDAIAASGCTDCGESPPRPVVAAARSRSWTRRLEWFGDTGPEEISGVEVTDEGRVFGYTALWGTCHIGYPGDCVTPPHSASEYAYFRTGQVEVGGSRARVGQITMGTGHAPLTLAHARAAAHYDDTGWAAADVVVGENEHGIWFSGALRPTVTDQQVEALVACGGISGDWRDIAGSLELVAMLAVNVPGYPVPRRVVTAGALPSDAQAQVRVDGERVLALVGAGVTAVAKASPRPYAGKRARGVDQVTLARLARMEADIARLTGLTAHLRPEVARAALARIKGA